MSTGPTPSVAASAAAAEAAAALLAHAREAVRALVSAEGALDRRLLEREQHAVHGLAWLATYVEALRQMQGWAERLEAGGGFGELERDLLAVAFGELLARILGGIPMSQGETLRLGALGLDPAAIQRFGTGTVGELIRMATRRPGGRVLPPRSRTAGSATGASATTRWS